MAAEEIPFLMEVVQGTAADRKGGHIARRLDDGQLVLRETAQTPPEDEESFRDFRRWRYYNTNNLWVDLRALDRSLEDAGGVLELPLIVNLKTVDPRDPDSPPVIQLESAMGAAIGSFRGASLLLVPRTRFVPVKTTDDLWSFVPTSTSSPSSSRWSRSPSARERPPVRRAGQALLPAARPVRAALSRRPAVAARGRAPRVHGDVTFGEGVVVRVGGAPEEQPRRLEPGTVLEDGEPVITIVLADDHRSSAPACGCC